MCDWARFAFETTSELPDLDEALGQDRAREAVEFGIGIRGQGYNIFAFGPPGTGNAPLLVLRSRPPKPQPPRRTGA